MKTRTLIVGLVVACSLMIFATLAQAEEVGYADKSKAVAEGLVKASLNNASAVTFESVVVYSRPGPFGNVCGIVSGVNRYGQPARAYFVVSQDSPGPIYVGPIPPTAFKKSCSGNEVK